jgi:hypothetical protein
MSSDKPFSTGWAAASVGIYTAAEVLLGHLVGPLVVGAYVSPMLHNRVMMVLHLGSFLLGGLVVGVVSPGVRLLEPAVGAFVAVVLQLIIGLFMPHMFYAVSMDKIWLGGGIAFVLALGGAWTGERLMGNVESRRDAQPGRL